jgi:beta-glucosidase
MHSAHPHFTPPGPDVEKRIDGILAQLSLEEKIDLLGGEHAGTKANENAGIPVVQMSDGPTGVHWWTDRSTTYPASICAAAAWDKEMAYALGAAIGRDARARGIHVLLAPGVNIYRSPLCGRNFEYLGEDPCLASRLVVQYIRGCQDQAVATTVKHYAVNYQEFDRHHVSSDLDERTLREVYLPAFEAAVREGGTGALMTAYNLVNGVHCSEHQHLNNEILKGEWGFDGLVMSDWVSTYSAVGAANGGLDLEMPNAQWMNREKLLPAIQNGEVPEAAIDDKIRRLLRLAICFGWLDHEQRDESIPIEDEQTAQVALDVARGGIVLLKNDDGVLPIDRAATRTIAVVGATAHPAVIGGGGSSYNTPWRSTSILEGIQALAGDVNVVHATGVVPWRDREVALASVFSAPDGSPGLLGEYFNNTQLEGEPALVKVDNPVAFMWRNQPPAEAIDKNSFSIRWTGSLTPQKDGTHVFYVASADGEYRAIVGEETVFETVGGEKSGIQRAELDLKTGQVYPVTLEYRRTRGWNAFCFGWEHSDELRSARQAVIDAARDADIVVFCGGHTSRTEGEGFDRTFGMDPELETQLRDVTRANANTVVVLTAGGNVDMQSWIDSVKGLVHAWYPGQEGGTAVAEILFGDVNPSGKLPATFEKRLEDRSSFDCYHDDDGDKRVELTNGIMTGYRHFDAQGVEPQFPFGFGLSYTTFAYDALRLSCDVMRPDDTLTVSFDIANTGTRAGAEIAQLYIRDEESSVPRPVKELKEFVKVQLEPGERRTVSIELEATALRFYDPDKGWTVEPGGFEVLVGASCTDIRLQGKFSYEA